MGGREQLQGQVPILGQVPPPPGQLPTQQELSRWGREVPLLGQVPLPQGQSPM